MRQNILLLIILAPFVLFAQNQIKQASWQQKVDYNIQVTLNDDSNYLIGVETIQYTNNSPDTLRELYLHLYPNAYKNNKTAFAKQKQLQGKSEFYLAKESERGHIDGLQFTSQKENLTLVYSKTNPDCAKLLLPNALMPHQSLTINTPFVVKIPYTFSRLGHVGKSYQISQWFPKIAVYDVNGWNQFPYLDQGEFYSEYGDYEVSITIPKNYVVAATGNLQNEEELTWMKRKATDKNNTSNEFPNDAMKTLKFTEKNIHDFAFFADKKWHIATEEVTLKSGKKVTAWAFDTVNKEAQNGIKFIKKTLIYLSEHVGDYPYQTAKSCTGALVAGAGMEYPTVTIVGHQHETEVVHEIGHNWFYGILGSQERRYPWMDEGINSFYEKMICEKEETNTNKIASIFAGKDFEFTEEATELWLGLISSAKGDDAPVGSHSIEFGEINYATMVYARTALNMKYLMHYLGDSTFEACMKYYFQNWKFKHPLPGDIRNCFEHVSEKNLGWFFEGVLNDFQNYDFKITKIISEDKGRELEIHLKNKSGKPIALPITLKNENETITFWVDAFAHDTIVHFHNQNYTEAIINKESYIVETHINNNRYVIPATFHHQAPIQFRFSAGVENKYRKTIFVMPLVGSNKDNKLMFGAAFYNSTFVRKKLEYAIAPLYATATKNLNGYAAASYTFMPRKKFINTWSAGVLAAKFNTQTAAFNVPIVYTRLQPYIQLNITKPSNASHLERFVRLDYTNTNIKATASNDTLLNLAVDGTTAHYLNLLFNIQNKTMLHPYKIKFWMEKNFENIKNDFLKLAIKGQYKINYEDPKKYLTIDLFAGKVFYKTRNNNGFYDFYLASESAYTDYKYWYALRDRHPGNNSSQLLGEQGGVCSNLLPFNTSNASATLRFRADLPFTKMFRPYLDLGSYKGIYNDYKIKLFYTSGISLVAIEDVLEINFPLAFIKTTKLGNQKQYDVIHALRFVQSEPLNDVIANNGIGYWQTVTFILNLNALNPLKFVRNFNFGN